MLVFWVNSSWGMSLETTLTLFTMIMAGILAIIAYRFNYGIHKQNEKIYVHIPQTQKMSCEDDSDEDASPNSTLQQLHQSLRSHATVIK